MPLTEEQKIRRNELLRRQVEITREKHERSLEGASPILDAVNWVFSGPEGGPGLFQDPVEFFQSGPSLPEAAKRIGGGTVSGLTLGAVEPFKKEIAGTAGAGAGELLGTLAPLGAALKIAGPVAKGALGIAQPFLPGLTRALTGTGAGLLTGAGREIVDVAKGEGFDPENIVIEGLVFGTLDAALYGAGRVAKNVIGSIRGRGMVSHTSVDEAALVEGFLRKSRDPVTIQKGVTPTKDPSAVYFSERGEFDGRLMDDVVFEFDRKILEKRNALFKGPPHLEEGELISPGNVDLSAKNGLRKIKIYTSPSRDHIAVGGITQDHPNWSPENEPKLIKDMMRIISKEFRKESIGRAEQYANKYDVRVEFADRPEIGGKTWRVKKTSGQSVASKPSARPKEDVVKLSEDPIVNRTEYSVDATDVSQLDLSGNPIAKKTKIPIRVPAVRQTERQGVLDMNQLKERLIKPTQASGKSAPVDVSLTNPIFTFEDLGQFSLDKFYWPIKEGEHAAKLTSEALRNSLKATNKQLGLKKASSERIMDFAVSQQAGGAEILAGQNITVPTLTPAETESYTWMRGILEDMFGKINVARKMSGKAPLNPVENYFTFFRNLDMVSGDGATMMNIAPSMVDDAVANSASFRFAKQRTGDTAPIVRDAFQVFQKYVEDATYFMEISPRLAKMNQMIDGKFADGINFAEHNPNGYQFLKGWINDVAKVDLPVVGQTLDRIARTLNRNVAWSVLSFNVRSAAIQPVALANATALLGPKWVGIGAKDILTKSGRAALKESKTLLGREYEVAVVESMEGILGSLGGKQANIAKHGLLPLKLLDAGTARVTWLAGRAKGLSQGMTKKQAGRFADEAVIKTQASAARSDRAPIQRTAPGQTLSLFNTFVIQEWNTLNREIIGTVGKKLPRRERLKRILNALTAVTAVNVLYEDVLSMRSPFPAPLAAYQREFDKTGERGPAIGEAFLELLEVVPIIGGSLRYGSVPYGAVASTIYDAGKALTGKLSTRKTLETAGKLLGVPGATQISKLARTEVQ